MAVTDYGGLKTAVASYLNRSDLTSYIPDFITQGQRRVFYGSDAPYPSVPLRIPAMQARTTGSGTTISFPTNFLEIIRLRLQSGTIYWPAEYLAPAGFTKRESDSDLPKFYTYLNDQIELAPPVSVSYTLDYYEAFSAFSGDTDTDWLLTNHHSIYLFAALIESAPFLGDSTMIEAWHGFYKSQISALNRSANRQAGPLQVRPG